jgi:hypothetical protein
MVKLDTETTPLADCMPLLESLKERGAPVEWHVYPGTTHAWDKSENDGHSKQHWRGWVTYRYSKAATEDSVKRAFGARPRDSSPPRSPARGAFPRGPSIGVRGARPGQPAPPRKGNRSGTSTPPVAPQRRGAQQGAPHQCQQGTSAGPSPDHLIRPQQQRLWNRQAKDLGCLQIDHKLELCSLPLRPASTLSGRYIAHRITSSARPSTDGGIVRPKTLAVLRLITSSNFVGCSTGMSPGFAPLRILST